MNLSRSFFTALLLPLSCLSIVSALQAQPADAVQAAQAYDLIPYPSSLEPGKGEFVINGETKLAVSGGDSRFKNETRFLQEMIRKSLGAEALKQNNRATSGVIVLSYDPSVVAEEGYTLSVNQARIVLKARTATGMFHAIETLRQLLPASVETEKESSLAVPAVEIADQPAFAWRGMMLDVSRHFFSVEYVKRFIDRMALYKFNRLHLHLTDDQGWRIEIKKYPRLTSESGWRLFNVQDSACMREAEKTGNPDFRLDSTHFRYVNGKTEYGGFYTQEQMKGIIRYAASRHIEIIPEIDMPGHMMAAIRIYPWLTCSGTPGADGSRAFSSPICPCKDSSVQFVKNILSEIFKLFPSKYVHIGGDEVEKRDWEKSALCKQFMEQHHIENLDKLQSYFNDRLLEFFHAHGKTLVGWDEIVEGGIDSSAVVMFWRPWARLSPLKATRNGNKVVMTPDGPLYFDAWPDRHSLSMVYHYNPADTIYGMNETEQQNVIGVQANLWSEMVPTESRADYLTMPRMTALAELGWTHKDLYDSYLKRLTGQYDRLDRLNIHYRLPDLTELAENQVFTDTTSFFSVPPLPALTIHYTTDGTNPGVSSPVLSRPVSIDHSITLKAAAFTASGRRGDVHTILFDRQSYASPVNDVATKAGLECRLYKDHFNRTTEIKATADSLMQVEEAAVPAGISLPEFALKFTGYIDVPETGVYSFFLTSNDGSVLHIADRLVVDNDGPHSDREKSGQVALEKGPHPFALDFVESGGGYSLKLQYSRGNGKPQDIPSSWFKSGL